MNRMRSIQITAACATLAAGVALGWSQTTTAAVGAPGTTGDGKVVSTAIGGMPARIDAKEVEEMNKLFDLTDDQRALVQAIYDGYATSYAEQGDLNMSEMRQMREEARASRDFRTFAEQLRGRREEWYELGKQLEVQFFNDVQSILAPEQQGLWPNYERDYRRRSTLSNNARFSGEGVDLIELVETFDLTEEERAAVNGALDSYAIDLDRVLVVRNELFEQYQSFFRSGSDKPSPEQRIQVSDRLDDQRRLVRDTNDRYAQTIASQLPAEKSARFLDEYQKRSFPWVFRDTLADQYMDRVERLDSLGDDQRGVVTNFRVQYDAEMAELNRRLMALQREREDKMKTSHSTRDTNSPERRQQIEEARRIGQQIGDAHRSRQELVDRAIDTVYHMLTVEQQEEAPKPNLRGPDEEGEMSPDGRPGRPGRPPVGPGGGG